MMGPNNLLKTVTANCRTAICAILTQFFLLVILGGCVTVTNNSLNTLSVGDSLSSSMIRYLTRWQQLEPHENEYFTSFKYHTLKGLPYEVGVSRRDPSSIIQVDGIYYIYYSRSISATAPVGYAEANRTIPATTWDMCAIYYATSADGETWIEQGAAIMPGPDGEFDDRSVFTPDILVFQERYYLYYQAVKYPYTERSKNVIAMSWADHPAGPWHRHPMPVLSPGRAGEWVKGSTRRSHIRSHGEFDSHKVHDPNLLIRNGQIWLYYKAHPMGVGSEKPAPVGVGLKKPYPNFSMGLAIADKPEGPFEKHHLNPVSASGHEAVVWPYKDGVATLITANGPEKNTVQWAKDGVNFEIKSHIVMPPDAAGIYCPDKYLNTLDGTGFTWGISHVPQSKRKPWAHLIGFKCDLSSTTHFSKYKQENIRYDEHARINSTRR